MFQSTLPWWERLNITEEYAELLVFQSTLPWWERLSLGGRDFHHYLVSIHAPVVGATRNKYTLHITTKYCFNPRSRGGSDLNGLADLLDALEVSIHAPVVGAT